MLSTIFSKANPLILVILVLVLTAPIAMAKDRTLTVYTYDAMTAEWGAGPKIKRAFEAQCDCILNWVAMDSSIGMLGRLQMEGGSGKSDVVLGLDTNLMQRARRTDLLAPHGLDLSHYELTLDWDDDIFLPFDDGALAFIYDAEKLPNPPKSLKELVEKTDGPSLLIQDPRTSTPGLSLLLWMKAVYGAEAAGAWAKLAPRIVTVTKGWGEAYGLFLKGEADMVLSYTTSPAYHRIMEQDNRYRAALFAEGQYRQVEVAARLKHGPNPDLAKDFLAFMLSEDFQRLIPTGHWMYPVIPLKGGLPEAYDPLPEKLLFHSSEEVETNRQAWIQEWLEAMSR